MKITRITIYVDFDDEEEIDDVGMVLNRRYFYWIYEPIDIIELYYINNMLRWPFNENR